jgi:hypothetical protein
MLRSAGDNAQLHHSQFETKRRPGRPKGSKSKTQPALPEPKQRGRPRGTGPKQVARAMAGDNENVQKRPVGRPPKHAVAKKLNVRLEKLVS